MSLIDGQPHSATVRADTQTDALVLGRAEFSRCLPNEGSMAHSLLRGLVQRLREADRKIESLDLVRENCRQFRQLMPKPERQRPRTQRCLKWQKMGKKNEFEKSLVRQL